MTQARARTVLITGASQGIGAAIASRFASDGWSVLASAAPQDQSRLSKVLKKLDQEGRSTKAFCVDLANPGAASQLLHSLGRDAFVDALVICASIQNREAIEHVSYESAIQQFNVNFWSSFELVRLALPSMRSRRWGRIVFVSSVQEWIPHPEMVVYAALKAAMSNVVTNLATSEAPFGITINSIAPGTIRTPRLGQAVNDDAYLKMLPKRIPVGRLGRPEEIAAVCRMLCGEEGAFLTGARIPIDGGMRLARPAER